MLQAFQQFAGIHLHDAHLVMNKSNVSFRTVDVQIGTETFFFKSKRKIVQTLAGRVSSILAEYCIYFLSTIFLTWHRIKNEQQKKWQGAEQQDKLVFLYIINCLLSCICSAIRQQRSLESFYDNCLCLTHKVLLLTDT